VPVNLPWLQLPLSEILVELTAFKTAFADSKMYYLPSALCHCMPRLALVADYVAADSAHVLYDRAVGTR
jgi:hypothetical protein